MSVTFNYYPHGKAKAVTLSYDDGQIYDKRLVEIFNRYGIKGTFHLNSANLGKKGYVNQNDVREIYAGHEVALHTHTHPFISHVPRERMIQEVLENRKELEQLTGYVINGMSYPMNSFDENVISKFRECGVLYSRTTNATGGFMLPEAHQ